MICRPILACLLCVIAFLPLARADEQVETLEQLRRQYEQARDITQQLEDYTVPNPDAL